MCISLVTLEGFCQIIKDVHLSSGLPVLADADTGFGEGEMCAKTVWEYFNAGAAGIILSTPLLSLHFILQRSPSRRSTIPQEMWSS